MTIALSYSGMIINDVNITEGNLLCDANRACGPLFCLPSHLCAKLTLAKMIQMTWHDMLAKMIEMTWHDMHCLYSKQTYVLLKCMYMLLCLIFYMMYIIKWTSQRTKEHDNVSCKNSLDVLNFPINDATLESSL